MAMRSSAKDSGSINKKLSNFLMAYRNAPHTTTNETPAKLFMGRNLSTWMDLIKPNVQHHVEDVQSKMLEKRHSVERSFEPGQTVAIRDYRWSKPMWTSGTVSSKSGPVSYRVEVAPGVIWRRHVDQLRDSNIRPSIIESEPNVVEQSIPITNRVDLPTQPTSDTDGMDLQPIDEPIAIDSPKVTEKPITPIRRNPKRHAGTPKRFEGFVKH